MANIIHIREEKNRLWFDGTYTPIVCGNTNYFVLFDFSEDWLQFHNKTAVFVIGDKRKQLKFEGNVLKLPLFPNAPYVEMLVFAKDDEECISTTAIKIRLEPTPIGQMFKF